MEGLWKYTKSYILIPPQRTNNGKTRLFRQPFIVSLEIIYSLFHSNFFKIKINQLVSALLHGDIIYVQWRQKVFIKVASLAQLPSSYLTLDILRHINSKTRLISLVEKPIYFVLQIIPFPAMCHKIREQSKFIAEVKYFHSEESKWLSSFTILKISESILRQ